MKLCSLSRTRKLTSVFSPVRENPALECRAQIDRLHAVRVHYDSLAALQHDLDQNAGDYAEVNANYVLSIPVPPKDPRAPHTEVPVGNNLLGSIGVTSDPAQWGRGVTIAVLDSGVTPQATLIGRLQYLEASALTAQLPPISAATAQPWPHSRPEPRPMHRVSRPPPAFSASAWPVTTAPATSSHSRKPSSPRLMRTPRSSTSASAAMRLPPCSRRQSITPTSMAR